MSNYSHEFKSKLAKEYLSTKTTYEKLAEKYGLPDAPYVGKIINSYQKGKELQTTSNRKKRYDKTFKANVISYMYDNNISALATSYHFNVAYSSVLKWKKEYHSIIL